MSDNAQDSGPAESPKSPLADSVPVTPEAATSTIDEPQSAARRGFFNARLPFRIGFAGRGARGR